MKKLIIANWKLNPETKSEAETILKGTAAVASKYKTTSIVVCMPFPFIYLHKKLNTKKLILGAQNVSDKLSGPYTGEVSVTMLKNLGVKYCIVGHSEHRSSGETNQMINTKVLNLTKSGITPVLCVGESSRDSHGGYLQFIKTELQECLSNISKSQAKNIVIAYEPVWAIGANATREATVEEFIEVKIFIRKIISDLYGANIAHNTPVIYGGSVNPQNASGFVKEGGADGYIVGRDSLNPKKFGAIVSATQ